MFLCLQLLVLLSNKAQATESRRTTINSKNMKAKIVQSSIYLKQLGLKMKYHK